MNMKTSKMQTKEWRQFELLITRLEKTLKPQGYQFKSPDKLIDYDTNELREVDCSIRYVQDNIERIISIECRKRGYTQDVTWIEQLACKMESLRLTGTIAVSSKGFSRAATLKAERRGITTNTFKEIVEQDILTQFYSDIRLNHIRCRWKLLSMKFEAQDDSPEISGDLMKQFQNNLEINTANFSLLTTLNTNESITLGQIVEMCLNISTFLPNGVVNKTYELKFESNTIALTNIPLRVCLLSLKLKLELNITRHVMNDVKLGQYLHGDTILIEVATGTIDSIQRGRLNFEVYFRRGIEIIEA